MEGIVEDQEPIEEVLRGSWKILLVRGVFISLIGLILVIRPSAGLTFTAISFSVFVAIDGITQLVLGFRMNHTSPLWWGSVLRGVLEILIAAVIVTHPKGFGEFGASALLVILGIVLIISGIVDYQFRKIKGGIFSSIILFVLGVLLLTAPLFSVSVILRIIGFSSLAAGTARIFRVVQYKRKAS